MSSRPQRAHSSSAAAKSCSSEEKGRRPASARAQRELPQHLSSSAADRKSTRLNSSHDQISYAVFCLKKKHEIMRLARCWLTLRHCLRSDLFDRRSGRSSSTDFAIISRYVASTLAHDGTLLISISEPR